MPSRRTFLKNAAVLVGSALVPRIPWIPSGRELEPGQRVSLWWPWSVDHGGVMLEHRVDGERVSVARIGEPRGTVFRKVEIRATPPDGCLVPGRHEFVLLAGGLRMDVGGFDVSALKFGC